MTTGRVRKVLLALGATGMVGAFALTGVAPSAFAVEEVADTAAADVWSSLLDSSPEVDAADCTIWSNWGGAVRWKLPMNYPPTMEIEAYLRDSDGVWQLNKTGKAADVDMKDLHTPGRTTFALFYKYNGQWSQRSTVTFDKGNFQCDSSWKNGPGSGPIDYPSMHFVKKMTREGTDLLLTVDKAVLQGENYFRFTVAGEYIGSSYAGRSPYMLQTDNGDGTITLRKKGVVTDELRLLEVRTSDGNLTSGPGRGEQLIYKTYF